MMMRTPKRASAWLARLESYAEHFRADFRRSDQARWAALYLQGLLGPVARKTIGAMAPQLILPPDIEARDVAQALQNFVNQSPWDEQPLLARYRAALRSALPRAPGAVLLDDLGFAKQGQHSVGVQRQYSSSLGRKANCQVAVAVYHVGPEGACPLALRLYLPRAWAANAARLAAAGVPPAQREPQGKPAIALALLDALRAEGWPVREIHAGAGFADPDFRAALRERGLSYVLDVTADALVQPPETLTPQEGGALLSNLAPAESLCAPMQARAAGRDLRPLLCDQLGLDHFEGRSWRGFHHHACLVMLAFGHRWLEHATREQAVAN